MGVRGLTSYIRNDSSNFKAIRLHDTIVIIDGHNVINSLYINSTIPTQFNGEYMAFDVAIERFLQNLLQCNIDPIFIFDGIHEVSFILKSPCLLFCSNRNVHIMFLLFRIT